MNLKRVNRWVLRHHRTLEFVGVGMRITSFGAVSWLGQDSPFFAIWAVNTLDAILLSWCSWVRRDAPYILLNMFWILVGVVGILRAGGLI